MDFPYCGLCDGERLAPCRQIIQLVMPALDLGEPAERQFSGLCVGQRNGNGEVGNRQGVAEQIFTPAHMIVQHLSELLEETGGLLDQLVVGIAKAKFRLDDVLEIELARVTRKVMGIPAEPLHKLDLACAGRQQIRAGSLREIPHDGIGFP